MVTGFRVSPGGAQQASGVTPDLATFAKIIAGGLPGGAICGREALLELLDFEKAAAKGFEKIGHQGTYNANPVSAAAGLTVARYPYFDPDNKTVRFAEMLDGLRRAQSGDHSRRLGA